MATAASPPSIMPPRAIFFDLMGTLTDWHSSIIPILESAPPLDALPVESLPQLAANWRAGFFKDIQAFFERNLEPEDIDITHRRVLDQLLAEKGIGYELWNENVRRRLVDAWHVMKGWPDVRDALERLKKNFFIVVLANGSTRLQLDIVKSAELPMHTLLSSQLLNLTKPDLAVYKKAMQLVQLQPEECMMVAAHAYDLRAAKQTGMRTVYIQRTTEDLHEDMAHLKMEDAIDVFIDGTVLGKDHGLSKLADMLI